MWEFLQGVLGLVVFVVLLVITWKFNEWRTRGRVYYGTEGGIWNAKLGSFITSFLIVCIVLSIPFFVLAAAVDWVTGFFKGGESSGKEPAAIPRQSDASAHKDTRDANGQMTVTVSQPSTSNKPLSKVEQQYIEALNRNSGGGSANGASQQAPRVDFNYYNEMRLSHDREITTLAGDINRHLQSHSDFRGATMIRDRARGLLESISAGRDELRAAQAQPSEQRRKELLVELLNLESLRVRGLYKGILDSMNNGDFGPGFKEGTDAAYRYDDVAAQYDALAK